MLSKSCIRSILLALSITVVLFSSASCGSSDEEADNESEPKSKKVVYFNADEIEGSLKDTGETTAAYQRNGIIKSEVKVFMDTVLWSVDYDTKVTSTESDLNDDGESEEIAIENDPETNAIGAFIKMNGKRVDLFNLVSKEFLEAMSLLVDSNNYFVYGTQIQAVCIDLDGDDKKEIILAAGNDNGVLAVSVLKYSGGKNLYKEVGGIKGTQTLRFIIITRDKTIFAELFFTNEASFDPQPMNYVEYGYKNGALKTLRYRNE